MIQLTPSARGFVVRADEPVTVETQHLDGRVITYVYCGTDDSDREPVGAFDSTLLQNDEWIVL